ncbi:hypothetical protein SKAU_G00036100 [Synaphobranchus kaupii]|uniref:Uncharacterized protein n=1 Tax=Synaphobranchus kaupii TaxID=118154 RepID=A0A9Q1GH03_SYNKA|nr:hypothetical protein SKAU_G00036100 [Synaphobranchus kaupii]
MDAHTTEDSDYRAVSVCQKGCGLVLLQRDMSDRNHCCVRALRTENRALLLRSARLEHEAQKRRARWGAREQHLLAQVTSLHYEARLAAVTYQKKLQQYMLHISDITKQLIGLSKGGGHDCDVIQGGAESLRVPHSREGESQAVKIRGGALCQDDPQQDPGAERVSVSHVPERGPAGQREELQVTDSIPQAEKHGVFELDRTLVSEGWSPLV